MNRVTTSTILMLAVLVGGCGFLDSRSEAEPRAAKADAAGAPGAKGGGGRGGAPGGGRSAAIPVRVVPVERRAIAQFLETNGTVESDNDVALVARTSGPIVELLVEEGMKVEAGQLLARIDDEEIRARLALATVNEGEADLAYQRAKAQYEKEILSRALFDQASAKLDAARASMHETQVQLDYTSIRAPFKGMIVTRFIKFAQHVQSSTPLFRISAFDPLQCPIQVPEKDLARLAIGQRAHLTVEAFPGERFEARVLRVSPVVDSATGTVKTTLEVATHGRLRPGMFASVFLETDRHDGALVIPKTALVLESIGDTVYVKEGDVARRRQVRLGYDEGDHVEVLAGLEAGQEIVVLGQDSLSDGTPVYVLDPTAGAASPSPSAVAGGSPAAGSSPAAGGSSAAGAETSG